MNQPDPRTYYTGPRDRRRHHGPLRILWIDVRDLMAVLMGGVR